MFKEERDQSQFEWSMLGDLKAGRPNLGPMTHVAVYRLMQFTLRDVLIREIGVEKADRAFFEAGKEAGHQYYQNVLTQKQDLNEFFADIQRTMKELNIGIFRVESTNPERGSFVITVEEDLDCSGIPVCSEQICTYDEGFIAGLLLAYSGKDYQVKEVDCWGSGARVCRFRVVPR
ncbi:MAG TPA: 4-vinyl reductase [Candidatus Paceibacterota bacterium]|nr:4-vinyl reductase [Verrucomicrobiota bacterium]HOX04360.1 4-vinyl reductase [Verrucomicrobiota bacterium]HRZ47261.1 4-vinyl reductase [Candidatus Paceibacterota bacterium]HRZ56963.1 4-vinyl reductase [Candidatus Paceibacterota bacterium]